MNEWFLILLLPFAAWSGWQFAVKREGRNVRLLQSRNAYFEGLTYLLNDQSDRAVNAFLTLNATDRSAFDNQLTLGSLFRKRGELDRALHIHKQLSSLENLDLQQKFSAEYELAEDFLDAGMYLQAQEIFESLVENSSLNQEQIYSVCQSLLRIYETSSQWGKAVELAEKTNINELKNRALRISHYYCELADIYLQEEKFSEADLVLNKALNADPRCGRAYWILAQRAIVKDEPLSAIHHYHSIAERASDFIPEILSAMSSAYSVVKRKDEFINWLLQKEEVLSSVRLTLAVANILEEQGRVEQAQELIKNKLFSKKNPLLLSKYLNNAQETELKQLSEIFANKITPCTYYQCKECGFRLQKLVWHCPSCYSWSSFRPLLEIKIIER